VRYFHYGVGGAIIPLAQGVDNEYQGGHPMPFTVVVGSLAVEVLCVTIVELVTGPLGTQPTCERPSGHA
jgi:fucose permease